MLILTERDSPQQWWERGVSLGFLCFISLSHLITLRWWLFTAFSLVDWEHAGLPNTEGEAEPSGFPPVSALELSCSASPEEVNDLRAVRRLPYSASALRQLLWKAQQSDVKLLWLLPHPWENAQGMWTAPRQPTGSWTRKCRVTVHPGASTQILSLPHAFSVGPLANAQCWTFQKVGKMSC